MTDVILVDFFSLRDIKPRAKAKNFIIEFMVNHPTAVISVVNDIPGFSLKKSKSDLQMVKFPYDSIVTNPLAVDPEDVFQKTLAESFYDKKIVESKTINPILWVTENEKIVSFYPEDIFVYNPRKFSELDNKGIGETWLSKTL